MFCEKLKICLHPHQYNKFLQTTEYNNEPTRIECDKYVSMTENN